MSRLALLHLAIGAVAAVALCAGCGPSVAGVGPKGDGGTIAGGCVPSPEVCDGIDNDCDGLVDEGFDNDHDGYVSCGAQKDCDDSNPNVHPGATEVLNGADDDCDGKVDNHIAGVDWDQDGTPYPQDCNDDDPLIGPNAIEVAGDGTDNNCNGQVDEVVECESSVSTSSTSAMDFAKAIGLCTNVLNAQWVQGNNNARNIRTRFGDNFTPRQGDKMVLLSSGYAEDEYDDSSYSPQPGHAFSTTNLTHPLWSPASCYPQSQVPAARDISELKLTLKVPQNANSFSFNVNFFSAEYPEYVCTKYDDRFIAILSSSALDPTKLPGGADRNCIAGSSPPACNVSFDANGNPLMINNSFFDICNSCNTSSCHNTCSQSSSLLAMTGYEGGVGGATGWLTTKAPVKPGETVTLRFIVLDEGDSILDSAALIDNFKWDAQAVAAPTTDPNIN